MATKKAKKAVKKAAPAAAKVTTTTTVVTKAAPTKKLNYWQRLNNIDDIDSLFSAKTLSLLFVEMIGAMTMAIIYSYTNGNQLFTMLSLGAIIMAFSGFAISFFNPIIVIGAWLAEKVSTKKMVLTVIAQVLGTMLAVVLLTTFIKAVPAADETAAAYYNNTPSILKLHKLPENKQWFIFAAEVIGGAILTFMAAQAHKRSHGEKTVIICGATLVALISAGALTSPLGASTLLNPALAIMAADFAKETWQWSVAVYILAPIVGGIIGFLLNKVLVKNSTVKTSVKTA
ncbi:MAG: aquaporin [Candidatus Saccharibacteria bacterium]|nr:aquaporin [Candidatus Saccharibacteria bacterium]